jgi:predicted methyltransferase
MFKASGAAQRLILCCVACATLSLAVAADTRLSELIAFAEVKSGSKVAHFLPTSDEYINSICRIVGDTGHVYAISVPLVVESHNDKTIESSLACQNITAITLRSRNYPAPELYDAGGDPGAVYEYYASRLPVESFVAPEPLDLIWIAGRYHDLHNKTFGAVNMAFVNAALFKALQPGGVLIVEDYSAKPGSGARDTANLHRIDVDLVKKEMAAAGFEFVNESSVLRNVDDRRTDNAHAIEAADRFLLKFRKP